MLHVCLRKLASFFISVRKTKTNCYSLAEAFPRFASATCTGVLIGSSDWLGTCDWPDLDNFSFGFSNTLHIEIGKD